jgi:IrrE N-terminal-like domain
VAILERGIAVESADDLGGALGISAGGHIQILNGLSPAQELVVLAHEYAHELLHRADDRPASRDTRELEAEAVAFVVAKQSDSRLVTPLAITSICIEATARRSRVRWTASSARRQ